MSSNFDSVPVVDYALLSQGKEDEFVQQLRHAAINVGFLYLAHPPIDKETLDALLAYIPKLFALPQEEKDMIWAGMEWGFENAYRLHVDMWRNRKNIRSRYSEFPGTITAHICPLDDHNFALDHFLTDNFIHDDWYDVVEHYYVLQQAAYISSIYISCTLSSRSPHSRFYL